MYENDHLIFLELQKTGTTSIVDMLKKVSPGTMHKTRKRSKHMELTIDPTGRPIFGSVRDPFD